MHYRRPLNTPTRHGAPRKDTAVDTLHGKEKEKDEQEEVERERKSKGRRGREEEFKICCVMEIYFDPKS